MPTTTVKKGGSLINDVNKLVVPFGLLLAQKGLSNMVKKDKKESKKSLEANKKAAVGGKVPKKTKVSKKGGSGANNLTTEFSKLSNDIKLFLDKY